MEFPLRQGHLIQENTKKEKKGNKRLIRVRQQDTHIVWYITGDVYVGDNPLFILNTFVSNYIKCCFNLFHYSPLAPPSGWF